MNQRNAKLRHYFEGFKSYRSSKDNRAVQIVKDLYTGGSCSIAYLHHNVIAVKSSLGIYAFSMGGWQTVTTGTAIKALTPWSWHYSRGKLKQVIRGKVTAKHEIPNKGFVVLDEPNKSLGQSALQYKNTTLYFPTLNETMDYMFEADNGYRCWLDSGRS